MEDENEIWFCTRCGAQLVMTRKKVLQSYDAKTGRRHEIAEHWWKCPNKKWFWDDHDQCSDHVPGDMLL